ncbi:MAG: hypothetical protein ACO20H_04915 [Bacteriovoracaceae bacterium]
MRNLLLQIRLQYHVFLLIQLFLTLPLVVIFLNYKKDFPDIEYLFFGLIFLLKIIFFREKEYRVKLGKTVSKSLSKELGRTPSKSEIVQRINAYVNGRDLMLGFSLFILFIVTLILA